MLFLPPRGTTPEPLAGHTGLYCNSEGLLTAILEDGTEAPIGSGGPGATVLVDGDTVANGINSIKSDGATSVNLPNPRVDGFSAIVSVVILDGGSVQFHDPIAGTSIGTAYSSTTIEMVYFAGAYRYVDLESQPDLSSYATTSSVLSSLADYAPLVSPSLTTPALGVASATSVNKVAITAPASGATLTIANGKTFTVSNTLTLAGTDGSTLNIGTGGTLGTAALLASGAANGVATLGADGKLPTAQLPAIAMGEVFSVASQAAMLALTAQPGDSAIRTDDGNHRWVLFGTDSTLIGSWVRQLVTGDAPVQTVNGQTGAVVLGKADVGLLLADNTSDANKPISTAQATAIGAKQNTITATGLLKGGGAGAVGSAVAGTDYLAPNGSGSLLTGINTTPAVIATGLLAEYRFDEGSGTVLTDYSGNGNTGTYTGSPMRLAAGGFTAANGKYATGTTGALATAQTIYVTYEMPTGGSFGAVLGTTVSGSLEYLTGWGTQLFSSGTGTVQQPSVTQVTLAITFDNTGVLNDQIFYDGKEVLSYAGQTKTGYNFRSGALQFGLAAGGHTFFGNIIHCATYSTRHTAAQIYGNAVIIREMLSRRGTQIPVAAIDSATTNQLLGVGDSTTAGTGGTPWISQLTGLVDTFSITNAGNPGESAAQTLARLAFTGYSNYFAKLGNRNVAVVWLGINPSASISACAAQIQAICERLKGAGWKVIVASLYDSSDSAYRQALATSLRKGWRLYADEFVDIASDPLIGLPGAYPNATYYSDSFHGTTASYLIVSKYICAAINRMLYTSHNKGPVGVLYSSGTSTVSVTNTTIEASVVGPGSATSPSTQTFECTTTNASTSVTGIPSTVTLVVGQPVSGPNIAAGTTIATIASATSITLSAAATATSSIAMVTFGGIPWKGYNWLPNKVMRFRQAGLISTAASPGNLTRSIKIGSTVMATTGAVALPVSLTAAAYEMDVSISCGVIGASGSFRASGNLRIQAVPGGAWTVYPMTGSSAVTLDCNTDALVDVTDTFSTASAGNSETASSLVVEMVNP